MLRRPIETARQIRTWAGPVTKGPCCGHCWWMYLCELPSWVRWCCGGKGPRPTLASWTLPSHYERTSLSAWLFSSFHLWTYHHQWPETPATLKCIATVLEYFCPKLMALLRRESSFCFSEWIFHPARREVVISDRGSGPTFTSFVMGAFQTGSARASPMARYG